MAVKEAKKLRKFVKQEDTIATAAINEAINSRDQIERSFANIKDYYNRIKIILNSLPAGTSKDKVKQYAREVNNTLQYWDNIIKSFSQPDTGGGATC